MALSCNPPKEDWSKCSLGAIVAPSGLGFCRAAVDWTLDPTSLSGAEGCCTVAGAWAHQRSLQVLASRLTHTVPELRRSAAESLGSIARASDEYAVAALALSLHDSEPAVRLAAAESLGLLANKGDTDAASVMATLRCNHSDPAVRRAAVAAYEGLCKQGDPSALMVLQPCMYDHGPQVRSQAVRVLAAVAWPGDSAAVSATAALLADVEPEVRQATVKALEQLARGGEKQVVTTAIAAYLKNQEVGVCQAAMDAMKAVATQGDPNATLAVVQCLEHEHPDVRHSAVQCLQHISFPSQSGVSAAIAIRTQDDVPLVRRAAVEMAIERARHSDAIALASVAACLRHSDEELYATAKISIEGILEALRCQADIALAGLSHPHRTSRQRGAIIQRRRLAPKRPSMVSAQAKGPEHPDTAAAQGENLAKAPALGREQVRPTAGVDSLPKQVRGPEESEATQIAAELFTADRRTRCAAVQILGQTLGHSDQTVSVATAAARLKDTDRDWRNRLAVEAASKILVEHVFPSIYMEDAPHVVFGETVGTKTITAAGLYALTRLAAEDLDPRVCKMATDALEQISKREIVEAARGSVRVPPLQLEKTQRP